MEFRSVKDATRALSLFKGLKLGDKTLQINRVKSYSPLSAEFDDFVVEVNEGSGKRQTTDNNEENGRNSTKVLQSLTRLYCNRIRRLCF